MLVQVLSERMHYEAFRHVITFLCNLNFWMA